MHTKWAAATAAVLMLAGCLSADGSTADRSGQPSSLPTPAVIMAANPPPPFTYWADAGSTIRNHGRQAGIWIAQAPGKPDRYYFGDRCSASRYQDFVGRPVSEMPAPPAGAEWRSHCVSCAVNQDLRWDRMTITFSDESRTVEAIACG